VSGGSAAGGQTRRLVAGAGAVADGVAEAAAPSRTARVARQPRAAEGRGVTRPLCWGVFLVTLGVYVLTANGHLQTLDHEYFYRMARALALEHTVRITPIEGDLQGKVGKDGRFYPQYAPGFPLVLAPVTALGSALGGPASALRSRYSWYAENDADLGARFLASYANGPITAATAALLTLLVLRLGYAPVPAGLVGLAYGLATPAWPEARSLFAEPLQTLLLLVSLILLLRATPGRALGGGAVLALAMLVKLTSVLALPGLLLLPDSRERPLWRRTAATVLVLAPSAAGVVVYAIYNVLRFGSVGTTGYDTFGGGVSPLGEPLEGLYGLLLSAGRGIVWYAPPVVAAVLCFRQFRAARPALTWALVALVLVWLGAHAAWRGWHGGEGWGPRYLLPVTPYMLVPLAAGWKDRALRWTTLALVGLGVLVQVPGATTDFMVWGRTLEAYCISRACPSTLARLLFDPEGSNLFGQTGLLQDRRWDLAWVTFGRTWVAPVTLGLAAALLGCGGALLGRSAVLAGRARRLALAEAASMPSAWRSGTGETRDDSA